MQPTRLVRLALGWLAVAMLVLGSAPVYALAPGDRLPPRTPPPENRLRPAGAHIRLIVSAKPPVAKTPQAMAPQAQTPLDGDEWTVVQWQDAAGHWHDVTGWQGTLDTGAHKTWFVAQADLGKGPFRWVVLTSEGGAVRAASDPFHLPDGCDQLLTVPLEL